MTSKAVRQVIQVIFACLFCLFEFVFIKNCRSSKNNLLVYYKSFFSAPFLMKSVDYCST